MPAPTLLKLGPCEVDLVRHEVRRPTVVALTPLEVALLRYLADRPGQAVHRDDLLEHVWGWKRGLKTRAVFHAVVRLRRKIEPDPDQPRHLVAVFGVGYRLELGAPETLARSLGRDREWAALARAGAFATLVGIGGIGKSTLARHWAAHGAPERRVAWVEAEGVPPDALPLAIARALGMAEAADPEAALADTIREVGIVLDDVAPGQVPMVAAWAARGGRWVATARAPLGVPGEEVVPVGPLALPGPGGPLRADLPAVRLFLEAARVARPELVLGDGDAEAVHAVVTAQGGHPLATRLAGGRLAALGLDDLRAQPPAGDALAATLARSLAPLDPADRALLRALAAIPTSAPLPAVIALGGTAARVERLVRAGLLTVEVPAAPPREARYGVLPPVRAALEPGLEEARAAWSAWSAWLARLGDPVAIDALDAPDGALARRRLAREAVGLQAAAERALDEGADDAGTLVTAVHHAAWLEGPYGPAVRLAERLRARSDGPRERLLVARAWQWIGRPGSDALLEGLLGDPALGAEARDALAVWCLRRGRTAEGLAHAEAAVAGLVDRPGRRAGAARHLAWALRMSGRFDEAREALAIAREVVDGPDHWLHAGLAHDLGNVDLAQGRTASARAHFEDAARRHAAAAHATGEAHARHQLAILAMTERRWDDAGAALGAYLEVQRRLGDRRNQANALVNLGIVAMQQGRPAEGEAAFERAAAGYAASGDRRGEGSAWLNLGCALADTEPGRARRALERAVEAGRASAQPRVLAPALSRLADLTDDPAAARALAHEAVALAGRLSPEIAALARCTRARLDPEVRSEDLAAVDALLPQIPEGARAEVAAARARIG